ncbi:hypothetical protein [Gordonia sp. N1V]|uniref:DUF7426 family protein n=1 Tax=Gordonia sp. N1V TaxID=3034163 RepID=UPI0023E1FB8F|nr:hypothetical protein [Gordonia sp. N1V]MDF3280487.1 hypothetical protein [Gordonia sp. N1V]
MEYPDLDDFFDPCLRLPIGGTVYVIEPPSAMDVIRLRRKFADTNDRATALERLDWQAKMFGAEWDAEKEEYVGADGSVWAQMLADGVGGEEILRAANTALLHFGVSPDMALTYWGPDDLLDSLVGGEAKGKGPGSNRKQRRAKPKKATSSKGATASTTPAQAP